MFISSRKIAAVALIALAATGASVSIAHAQTNVDFPDVKENHWAYQAVHELADKGLVKGYPDGKFLGDRALTRFEFATVVARLLDTIGDMKAGAAPTSGVTQDDLNKIQVLVDKFQPQLDAIQANVTKAQSDIDTLRQEIDDLRQDVQDTKDIAGKAQDTANNSYGFGSKRKFQISGYLQARYITAGSDEQSDPNKLHYPTGKAAASSPYNGTYMANGNSATPEVRRSRVKFYGQVSQHTRYTIQLDASSNNSATPVSVREGNFSYTFNDGNPSHNATLTAGIFANPFGYMLPLSSASTFTPERPLAFNEGGAGLFNGQDYDKGAQIQYPSGRTKFTLAGLSGAGYGTGAFPATDTDRAVDQVYRIAYNGGSKLSGGVSYYYGRISTTSTPYVRMRKELEGADLQYTPTPSIFVNGEWLNGLYEQRTAFTGATQSALATATVAAPENRVEGYYVQGGYVFSPLGSHPLTVGLSYDVLRRATDGPGSNSSYDDNNIGYGVLYNLDTQTRLRFWYETPNKVAHTPASPDPQKVGLFTTELQVKF